MRRTQMTVFLSALIVAVLWVQAGASAKDTTPTAFDFGDRTHADPNTLIESEPATISGINAPAPISITGGEYSIDGRPYRIGPTVVKNNQQVRVRVRSSDALAGSVSATLSVGGVSGAFRVKTVSFSRVEAEAATLTGGANEVADGAATNGAAVFVGSEGSGVSIVEALDARALIIAYRADVVGTLSLTINGDNAGEFAIRPTGGAYATASVVATIAAGDVVAIASPSAANASDTFIDYVEFGFSPFRSVSTVVDTDLITTDGTAIGPNGDIYVSGGEATPSVLRITPEGDVSVFATGFVSANSPNFDSSGNLYVADYAASAVRKITPDGVMTTFASFLDGPAGVWVDPDDNVLVSLFGANFSRTGATVLKITPDGTVSTYATGGGLQDVIGIVGDENGDVYASNWDSGELYKITDGQVSLLADTGGRVNLICYSDGYIYVPSPGDAQVRRVSLTGAVEPFIGTFTRQTIDGPLDVADFERPNSCAVSADGTVMYLMDRDSGLLRKVDSGAP